MEEESAWRQLENELEDCSACPLRGDCKAPVGWFGDPKSPLLLVGEGPGGVEDEYGCPLIGPSGQLLDKALWSSNAGPKATGPPPRKKAASAVNVS